MSIRPEILVVIATFFVTGAQLAFKLGSSEAGISIGPFSLTPMIILGFISYGISAFLFIFALRNGQLSALYPIWALSFVWIFLVSMALLGETVSLVNWVGAALIITGVSLVGRGSKNG